MQKYALLFLFFLPSFLSAQDIYVSKEYPQTDFRPPLNLPPSLAGTFGELRSNHFHSGLDYRTNQREGYPVYAASDGYVSRLRAQIGGGGNIIYLTHPNGYSTVYMHLQRFSPKIQQQLRDYQYKSQRFDVDFFPEGDRVEVKKGEVIAWSGNTGGTAGPHLHFEIRDSKTEETINAQLFGINIPDKAKPVITGLYLYQLYGQPFSESTRKQHIPISGRAGNYTANFETIAVNGQTGFGIATYDQYLPGVGKNGVYSIELTMDGTTIYSSVWEKFNFANSRAINSHIDYPALYNSGVTIQKSFVEPGNPLGIYRQLLNNGLISIQDSEVHSMEYIVKDVKGNSSMLKFKIKNTANAPTVNSSIPGVKHFAYSQDNEFRTADFRMLIPKGNLYSDIDLKYSVTAKPQRGYSLLHHVHTRLIPIHDSFSIWIKPDSTLRDDLRDKAIIIDANRGSTGGIFEDGYVKANARYFGNFYIAVDTISPVIRPVNIANGKSMTGVTKAVFKISDNLSGIKSFNATIDGSWVLMDYDQKTATLWHTFEKDLSKGKHVFEIVVTDQKLNNKTYTANFTR